jgi:glycosyltransferase involved in cell wall biosynthesis
MASQIGVLGIPTVVVSNPAPPTRGTTKPSAGPLRLVFAGRVEPEKGLARFLEAVPLDETWSLDVVGEGEELAKCRQVVRERSLDGRVRWLGRLNHERTLEVIGASHVLVLPSVWPENQPLVMLEALAAGTSLLASALGGMREIVEESGVGALFAPGASATLADSLRSLAAQRAAGTLNRFDATAYLAERSEDSYFTGLLRAYGIDPACRTLPANEGAACAS